MEKNVILEEISMYEDQPSFTCYDHIMATHLPGIRWGKVFWAVKASITALTADQMQAYHRSRYHTGNITLAIAGNCASKMPWRWRKSTAAEFHRDNRRPGTAGSGSSAEYSPGRPRQQCAGAHHADGSWPGISDDELRFAAELLSVVVGDDSGSRLFWELVDPGHAESADLSYSEYDGAGAWMTISAVRPKTLPKIWNAAQKSSMM
jgi:predicted Zn-dependent peptidase